ncbi:MAG: type II toxin-antitoxin system RelB/DinJ family antitoxin [Treponema sp.]|jgi:DNA-damage-inducible protein J|nr:type II toxin-antitoxin system RelB/DinJ family antitoxin [Treponema sp.]
MAQTNVSVLMDSKLKHEAEKLFSEMGLSMSAAITVFIKQSLNRRQLPFPVSGGSPIVREGFVVPKGEEDDPFWSEVNLRHIRKGIEEAEAGKLTEHELIEVSDEEIVV